MRAPYTLYKRKSGKKTPTYYVAFWSEARGDYTGRTSVQSIIDAIGERAVGMNATSKAGAQRAVDAWLKAGAPSRRGETFWTYLESFWGREGEYARMLREAGRSITNAYADDQEDVLAKFVKPYLEKHGRMDLTLSQVDAGFIETMLRSFRRDYETTGRRLNQIRQAIGVAMKEAHRLGKIARNPVTDVMKFKEDRAQRQILTRAEAAKLFRAMKDEDERSRVLHLLAATTGMRMGECLGLTIDRLKEETVEDRTYYWIELDAEASNWTESDRHHGAKSGSTGEVPVPERTAIAIRELHRKNPWRNEWVFWSTKKDRPMSKRDAAAAYNRACRAIGISDEKRKERGLGTHAWRHFYVSVMRGLSDARSVQDVVRHKSASTTALYSHLTDEQRREIADVAGGLVES